MTVGGFDDTNAGLVLEGGGLRGVYTSGVLRFFMDKGLHCSYVIGVSMGACNAANYISKQPERNRIVNIRYVKDSRYISHIRLFTKGELFGMSFIFDTIPNSLVPFDYRTFEQSDQKYIITVTDCLTGEPFYFEKSDLGDDFLEILQASSSLPFISRPVHYDGRVLMDGGLSDPVPIRKSIEDGNTKHILVLTRPKGYRKDPPRFLSLVRMRYPRYEGLCSVMKNRHIVYNDTMDLVDRLEAQREVFVIRPGTPIRAGRIERNKDKLYAAYDQGYADAVECYPALCSYLGGN